MSPCIIKALLLPVLVLILHLQECEDDSEVVSDSDSEYLPSGSSDDSDHEFTDSDEEEEGLDKRGCGFRGCSCGLKENQQDLPRPDTPRPDTPMKTRQNKNLCMLGFTTQIVLLCV